MHPRLIARGLTALALGAIVSAASLPAFAQTEPVRVVQDDGGTLYLVHGATAWTLVPDQTADASGLNVIGEVDGTLPNDVLIVQAPAPLPAPQAQIRVDVNKELNTVSTGYCPQGGDNISKLSVSLASVDRQADGRSVWHVGILNQASLPVEFRYSAAYILAGDGTKYDAGIADPLNVAVGERKALDVIPQQNNIPAGAYRLFFLAQSLSFAGGNGGSCVGRGSAGGGPTWSSTPISLP